MGALTLIVGHQLLQGAEGGPRGDVEAPVVQGADLVVLHCVPVLGVVVPYGQRVAPCIRPEGNTSEWLLPLCVSS